MSTTNIKQFTSPIDDVSYNYYVDDGVLSYKIEGTDWQDFTPNDRAYTSQENVEFLSLLYGGVSWLSLIHI